MPSPLSTSAFAAGWLAFFAFGAPARFLDEDEEHKEPENPVAHAGELFLSTCITCHQPPDRRFETDRAWLNQVHDTA